MANHDILVKGARVIDTSQDLDGTMDIAVANGSVVGIGDFGDAASECVIDGAGLIASPGWIDLHAHVFPGYAHLSGLLGGVRSDEQAGIDKGVTTVVDAGTVGAGSWNAFKEHVIDQSTTQVLGYMNVSLMQNSGPRHGDWTNFDQEMTIALAEQEVTANRCVGIKVLASQSQCGNLGIIPLKLARQAARLSNSGLMVHLGESPPTVEDVLDQMDFGDILTHCWKGMRCGLLGADNKPLQATREAVDRGVKFDIGHGTVNFSFDTARHALDAGLPLHAISTDIHERNVATPVVDMATTMSKFLHLGLPLTEVVHLVTFSPATLLGKEGEIGSLARGSVADVTLFRVLDGEFIFTDGAQNSERASQLIEVAYVIREGRIVKHHASDLAK